jgi:hypothetical protein
MLTKLNAALNKDTVLDSIWIRVAIRYYVPMVLISG